MTREKAKYAAEVMSAYAEGKAIQFKGVTGDWQDDTQNCLDFDWGTFDYKIKSDLKYIPFTYDDKDQYMIVRIDTNGVSIKVDRISYQDLFDRYLFSDGSPCGKVIE